MNWWNETRRPSVPEQRQRAARASQRLAQRLAKSGRKASPVVIDGRAIARSFWGKAWCDNLEAYRDYEYRLPRGRSYARHGAVLDLEVSPGTVRAVVCGTSLYDVEVRIESLAPAHWALIKTQCAGQVGSLIELLEGRFSDRVMRIITHPGQGLFPKPAEIKMSCSCPDRAILCKHVAAVMYGIGARLDHEPELLFTLRKVDHGELIVAATDVGLSQRRSQRKTLASEDLGGIFGIELAEAPRARAAPARRPVRKASGAMKAKGRGGRAGSRR